MDPTLAALLGAGIGAVTTVIAAFTTPVLTSRRAHKARQRELRQQVYVDGMQAYLEFTNAGSVSGLDAVRARIFHAQAQIFLLGTRRTSDMYSDLASLMDELIKIAVAESMKRSWKSPTERVATAFPPEKRRELGEMHIAFVDAARRDMAIRDRALVRLWRWIRSKW